MGELVEIVESLEHKVTVLLKRLSVLDQSNAELREELSTLREARESDLDAITDWEEKYNSLKLASSMMGSNTNKTEAKLKINTLIRDLDVCINQLAE